MLKYYDHRIINLEITFTSNANERDLVLAKINLSDAVRSGDYVSVNPNNSKAYHPVKNAGDDKNVYYLKVVGSPNRLKLTHFKAIYFEGFEGVYES